MVIYSTRPHQVYLDAPFPGLSCSGVKRPAPAASPAGSALQPIQRYSRSHAAMIIHSMKNNCALFFSVYIHPLLRVPTGMDDSGKKNVLPVHS